MAHRSCYRGLHMSHSHKNKRKNSPKGCDPKVQLNHVRVMCAAFATQVFEVGAKRCFRGTVFEQPLLASVFSRNTAFPSLATERFCAKKTWVEAP